MTKAMREQEEADLLKHAPFGGLCVQDLVRQGVCEGLSNPEQSVRYRLERMVKKGLLVKRRSDIDLRANRYFPT